MINIFNALNAYVLKALISFFISFFFFFGFHFTRDEFKNQNRSSEFREGIKLKKASNNLQPFGEEKGEKEEEK